MLGLAVIGCGRWGINHVRTAHELSGDRLVVVVDANKWVEPKVNEISDRISFTDSIAALAASRDINAVIIATPAESHFDTALRFFGNGKHVLVEKPITLRQDQAEEPIRISEEKNLKLMVGHLPLYHPAVAKMKEMLKTGKIDRLQYIYSNRLNSGTVRTEENILWSFAPYDISVIQFLTESYPETVQAMGAAFLQNKIEDSTITYLSYPGNVQAHIFVSWLHPFKEHRMVVIGDKGMLVFEDSAQKEKLRSYPKGFSRNNGKLEKFDGEYEVIDSEDKRPLAEEQIHFAMSITENRPPLTDGKHALEVLKILVQAEASLRHHANHDWQA